MSESIQQLFGGRSFPVGYKEERSELSHLKSQVVKQIAELDLWEMKQKLWQKDLQERILQKENEIKVIEEKMTSLTTLLNNVFDVLEKRQESLPPDILILLEKVMAHKEEVF